MSWSLSHLCIEEILHQDLRCKGCLALDLSCKI